MAPKHKSTLAQNPLGSESSSSNLVPPLHIQFHYRKVQQDLLENFQKYCIHPKCHVILTEFSDTPLPRVIRTWGWESLCEIPLRCPIMFIEEFYFNIHGINTFVPQFAITFKGTHIVVTPNLISEILHVPRVSHPNYLDCQHLRTVSKDKLLSHFCETPSVQGECQNTLCLGFAKGPRFLNMVMTFVLTPLSHYNSITEPRAQFLLSFLEDLSIDYSSHFITSIIDVYWIQRSVISSFFLWLSHGSFAIFLSLFLILLITSSWVPLAQLLFDEARPNFNRKGHKQRRLILQLLLFLPPSLLLP